MKINSNIQAMRTGNLLKNNEAKFTVSSEKMSSGYKINSAKDNPSGMAISNKMRAQLRSLNKANQNASNAVNVIETADSALAEIEDMIHRLNELSVKSANGTNTTEDREAIQSEVSQLLDEIETIAKDTEYNTQSLLGGEQRLKGYASMVEVEVEDYDPGFPYRDDYSVTFNSDGDGNVSVESSEGFENTAKITTEGDRITVTNHDGSKLVLSVDTQTLGAGSFTTTLDINGVGGMKIQTGALEGQEIQIVIPRISLENLHFDNMDDST